MQLLALTGARREEIFGLTEPEVREGAAINLPGERTKTGEPRLIPLSRPALEIVSALPRFESGPFLLSLTGAKPYSNFGWGKAQLDRRILEARRENDPKAEVMPRWTLHDLRRTVATGLQRLGTRLEVIEAVLGHVSGSRAGVVGIYQRHRFEAETRQALEAWGRHVEALVAGAPVDNVVAISTHR